MPEQGRVALFVGRGFRRKGLKTAVTAFRRVATLDDRMVVVGEDGGSWAARPLLQTLLGRQLVWMGRVADLSQWLVGADALLLPTRYDPAANVTLEAMACGVPPVTTQRDGNHEIVPHSSLVVQNPEDVPAVAHALTAAWALGSDPSLRAAAEAWPVSRNANELLSLIKDWHEEARQT